MQVAQLVPRELAPFVHPQVEDFCAVHSSNNAFCAPEGSPLFSVSEFEEARRRVEEEDPEHGEHGSEEKGNYTMSVLLNVLEKRGCNAECFPTPAPQPAATSPTPWSSLLQGPGAILRPRHSRHWVALARLPGELGSDFLLIDSVGQRAFKIDSDDKLEAILAQCAVGIHLLRWPDPTVLPPPAPEREGGKGRR